MKLTFMDVWSYYLDMKGVNAMPPEDNKTPFICRSCINRDICKYQLTVDNVRSYFINKLDEPMFSFTINCSRYIKEDKDERE